MAVTGVYQHFGHSGFFDLDGRVIDSESFARERLHLRQHTAVAEHVIRHDDMAARRKHAGGQRPNVKIMDGTDAGYLPQLIVMRSDIDVLWRSFQKDIDCVADEDP